MRSVILTFGLAVATACFAAVDERELIYALFKDIPAVDLGPRPVSDSEDDVRAVLEARSVYLPDAGPDLAECRAACIEAGKALEGICERHIKPEAAMSRAVCYGRVDDDRDVCVEACGG